MIQSVELPLSDPMRQTETLQHPPGCFWHAVYAETRHMRQAIEVVIGPGWRQRCDLDFLSFGFFQEPACQLGP
jgi:hypothetical protein